MPINFPSAWVVLPGSFTDAVGDFAVMLGRVTFALMHPVYFWVFCF